MDTDELTTYIVNHLSEGDDPDDIILNVCQKTGYSWSKSEEFIRLIQEKNELEITKKQFPLLTGVAFVTFAAGLVLTGYGLFAIITSITANKVDLGPRDITSYIMPVIENGTDPASALQPAIYPYFNFIIGLLISPVSAIIFGLAMIFGSLLGMRAVWVELLNR